jgi:hypothetical protein
MLAAGGFGGLNWVALGWMLLAIGLSIWLMRAGASTPGPMPTLTPTPTRASQAAD